MPEAIPQETIISEKTINEQLFNEIKFFLGNDRKRVIGQVDVLKKIPENLVELTYAHLQAEFINETEYQKKHNTQGESDFSDRRCIEGYVNEVMANIQIRQTQPELRGSINPETRKQLDEYEAKILSVANNPERYGLDWHVGRNPDVAWLDIDDQGRIIIKGIGEITNSSQLNKRKYLQLCENGFASNLRYVSKRLNHLENGNEIGLSEFGEGQKQLEVAPVLKKYLVVPHNFDNSPEGISNSIAQSVSDEEYRHINQVEQKKVLSATEKQSFIDILNSPNTVIIKSVFDNKEIQVITDYLIRKIQEKFPSYKFTNNHGR